MAAITEDDCLTCTEEKCDTGCAVKGAFAKGYYENFWMSKKGREGCGHYKPEAWKTTEKEGGK